MPQVHGRLAKVCRVAVLDSGITPNHPHIGNILEGIAITPQGTTDDYIDWVGHGTAVAAAILEKAPNAGLLIVKIFGRQLSANIDQLVMGIQWSLDQRADFINLSLGTQNENHCERFRQLIERSSRMGSQIVSARSMNGKACFPGSMTGVIGVEADSEIRRDEIRYSDGLAVASPYPRPIPGVSPERNLHGVSFAVANVTGYLCAQTNRTRR
jgi:subtilase family protein